MNRNLTIAYAAMQPITRVIAVEIVEIARELPRALPKVGLQ